VGSKGYRDEIPVWSPVSGAILTGGQSRRMGTDKALLRVGGTTMLERTLSVVQSISDDVFVVGERDGYASFGAPVVADHYVDTGTLGGIATALRHASHDRVLVVACDMPLLSVRLLTALLRVDVDADVVVPRRAASHPKQGSGGTYEPLHAVYRRSCLPVIERQLAVGDQRVVGFFSDVRVRVLDEGWMREFDPELTSLTNANTQDEFQRVLARIESESVLQEDVRG
jgi:molybdenum cofactor guanylyltransferase